jgi:hypothetical protein
MDNGQCRMDNAAPYEPLHRLMMGTGGTWSEQDD